MESKACNAVSSIRSADAGITCNMECPSTLTAMQKLFNMIESPHIQPQGVRILDDDEMDLVSVKVEDELIVDLQLCTVCCNTSRVATIKTDSSCTEQKSSPDTTELVNSPSMCFECFTQVTPLSHTSYSKDKICAKHELWDADEPYDKCDTYEYRAQEKESISDQEASCSKKQANNPTMATQCSKTLSLKTSEHRKDNLYQCKVCLKVYLKKLSLLIHKRKHVIEKNCYNCKVCDKNVCSQSSLQRHMLTHTGEKPYQCKVCYKRFTYSHCVTEHMRTDHPGKKPFRCEMCPEAFAQKQHLNSHVSVHIFGETDVNGIKHEKELWVKNNAMTPEEFDLNTMYLCDFCKGVFFSKSRLRRHVHTFNTFPHNDKASRSFDECVVVICTDKLCTECPKEFALNDIKGRTEIHYNYHCETCPISFRCRASYIAHLCTNELSVKSEKSTKQLHQCPVCFKRLSEKGTLKRHMRLHTSEKLYQCKCCLMKFYYSQTLYKHMRSQHPGEKPYKCEFCSKSFLQYYHLHLHTPTHTHRKCKVCNKMVTRHSLNRHMRLHTGEKPYQCNVCFKRLRNNLPIHMRSNHPEVFLVKRRYTRRKNRN